MCKDYTGSRVLEQENIMSPYKLIH